MSSCVQVSVGMLVILSIGCVACCEGTVVEGERMAEERSAEQAAEQVMVRGYRFRVIADANGDGRPDTLTERFMDPTTGQEADKFQEDVPYDSLYARIWRMGPRSLVRCSDTSVHDLRIRDGDSFGLAYLHNEGDLNGDGRDELGWVGDWVDYSNVNTYHISSWNDRHWVELASFGMWEWQLPDLPGALREYALIGQAGKTVSDSAFSPVADVRLVWPHNTRSIKVLGKTEEADLDTLIIPLSPLDQ